MRPGKLPATVTRGHTYVPHFECTPQRQMRCAGCKGRINFMEQYTQVVTDFDRHYWHPHCYDRKPRRHLTVEEFGRWCRGERVR